MKQLEARKPWDFPVPRGLEALAGRETPLVSPHSEDTPVFTETWDAVYGKPPSLPRANRPPKNRAPKAKPAQ